MAKRLMVKPSGERVLVPDESVQAAYAQGYRAETAPEVHARAERELAAEKVPESAVIGALRGLTLGLSDLALTSTGEYTPEELRAWKETNPKASLGGEFAGIAAGVATGAAGPGLAVDTGALVGGGIRGAMAEGGLYGLGAAISDATLSDDPELTGEKLFAGAAAGALGGGVLHIGGKALSGAAGALAGKLSGPGLRAAIDNFAEKAAVRQFETGADLRRNGLFSRENTIGRYMLDNLLPKAESLTAEGVNEQAGLARIAHGQEFEKIWQDVDSKALGFDSARLRVRAQDEILNKIQDDPALKPVTNKINDLLDGYDAKMMDFKTAWDRQSTLRTELGPLASESEKAAAKYQTQLRRIFRDEIISQAGEVAPEYSTELKDIARNYGSAAQVEKLTERAMQKQAVQTAGLGPALLGGVVAGPKGAAIGLAGGIARRFARERGGSIIAVGLDKLAKSGALEAVANGLKKTIDAGLESSATFGGAFRPVLQDAAAHGALSLLATHVRLAKGNPEYLHAVDMADETPDAAAGYANKLAGLTAIGTAAAIHDAGIEQGITKFLGGRPSQPGESMTPAQFTKIQALLQEATANPQKLAQMIEPGMSGDLAPVTSAALAQTGMRAINWLASIMPKPPRMDAMPALSEPWTPTPVELERFSRAVGAVEDPGGVIASLHEGASPEGIAALRAVYPKLVSDLQTRMMSRLAAWKEPLPHAQRLSMSLLFGVPVGGAGDPSTLKLIQGMHAAMSQPGQPGGGAGSDGRQNVNTVKNFETQAQRIEAR